MNIFSILSVIAFCSYLYIGFFIFSINPKSKAHLFFLMGCLAFALWSFGYIFIHNNMDIEEGLIWYKIAFTGSSLFETFLLYFALAIIGIYEKINKKILFFILTCIIPGIIIYKNITECAIIRDYPFGFWFISWMVYGYTYNFISIFLIYRWNKKSNKTRVKKQAKMIIIPALIIIIIGFISETFLGSLNIPSLAPITSLIWVFAIGYAVLKYRFMSITPSSVNEDIIKNINESIVLLDENFKIITLNKKTEELINTTQDKMKNQSISFIIHEHDSLKKEIENLYNGEYSDFSCRVNYNKQNDQKILMDTKVSVVNDKFNDIIGILIIGHEVKEMKQLKTIYQITDREADVIQLIISGSTNKEIADHLKIAERTIKTHITNIYNKLGVDNKIQLLHLLKDFNLIPEQSSDKTVLFFNK